MSSTYVFRPVIRVTSVPSVGKTNQRPPLAKVSEKCFVLVKVGNGKPFKAQSSAGVSYTKTAVTLDQVDVGGGVLSGTMACTSFDD